MSIDRTRRAIIAFVACVSLAVTATPARATDQPRPPAARVVPQFAPALFVENRGQFDARARFQLTVPEGTWWLADEALWFVTHGDRRVALRVTFSDMDPAAQLAALDLQAARMNYFTGRDPSQWHTDVPTFAAVRWEHVHPGTDVILSTGSHGLRMRVERGAPSGLRLHVEGAAMLGVDAAGRLIAITPAGRIELPGLYTEGQALQPYVQGERVTFTSAPTAGALPPLTPGALLYSTYLGGSAYDGATSITVDALGNAYVTGSTQSANFPTAGALYGTLQGGADAFVSKFNASGALVYSTYLGGSNAENSQRSAHAGIAVDATGSAYVTGGTSSADFPVVNAIQNVHGPTTNPDVFVTKLNPAGNALVYSTFLGDSSADVGRGIAVDSTGSAYVVGEAGGGFPVVNPIQVFPSGTHAFVAKINAAGTALTYSTYLGGFNGAGDYALGVAVDFTGAAYVTGHTTATDFPTVGAIQGALGGGSYPDAFVTKVNPTGSAWVYSTYLGGSLTDEGYAIAVDAANNAFVTGETQSTADFPIASAFRLYGGGRSDAFVTKLNAAGSAFVYSTYLGGNDDENYSTNEVGGIAAGSNGDAFVTGYTCSADFPLLGSLLPYITPRCFAFVSRFAPTGRPLLFSSLLGTTNSGGDSSATAIALGGDGSVYLAGNTSAPDFLTLNPSQPAYGGLGDAFVARLTAPPQFRFAFPIMLWNP
jgi:hypothetical protein